MLERPLSPHLQVYRLPLTALLSITHRATGVFLSIGMILLVILLMALAEGGSAFNAALEFLRSFIGRLFTWGWIFSLLFHSVHGLRHLVWDTGHSFDKAVLTRYAVFEIVATLALTGLVFFWVLFKYWI